MFLLNTKTISIISYIYKDQISEYKAFIGAKINLRPVKTRPLLHDRDIPLMTILCLDKVLDLNLSMIKLDSRLRQDLGADSLDTYEIIYTLEEVFDITIPDEIANEFVTVGNIVDFVGLHVSTDISNYN